MSDARKVTVEYRTPFPDPPRRIPALEDEVQRDMYARGIPSAQARMRRDGNDLVISYELTISES
ncbi:hypothetical protein [Streptomyces rubiginosohelvolus]|uniref:hypothetical protein n=1 Tax=Streptomyces rubiginosohelvolus TaxID=67362 RepID=UPI0033A5E298